MSFLLQEGVITIGTISGIFTALLLNSVKNNIIDPCVEKIAPIGSLISRPVTHIIDDIKDDGKLNNSNKPLSPQPPKPPPPPPQNNQNDQNKGNGIFNSFSPNTPNYGNQFGGQGKNEIKWKIFMRDLITWLIIMFILYFAWKHILHPIKSKNGVNVPSTNTQFIHMNAGMGKKK